MEQEQIIAGNKLIAAFMGFAEDQMQMEDWCGCNVLRENWNGEFEMMPYTPESNWSELMPVGKKILDYCQSLERPNKDAVCKMDWIECEISSCVREYNITGAYEKIIEFITLYNLHTLTPKP